MMKKIIIEKTFFDLKSPRSAGLISGLKKLSNAGLIIETKSYDVSSNKTLKKILDLDDISVHKSSSKADDNTLFITAKSKAGKNTVFVKKNGNFSDAVNEIMTKLRSASRHRKTKETDIKIQLSLDGKGKTKIDTGIGFFDHMLEQIARHANINLIVNVKGDLHIDEHHTVEDVGITLGETLSDALGMKLGIKRYGYFLPMDDAIAQCAVDLGGRSYLNFKVKFEREKVGEFPTELTEEFFRGLAGGLKANIYIRSQAKNDHHKIESIFKAFAKSLNEACRLDERNEGGLPSTKGTL
jgi:imidazoleglycerol-phosphate dehydratase/histidinol-phosphatase